MKERIQKLILATFFFCLCGLGLAALKTQAAELDLTVKSSDKSDGAAILDKTYRTTESFEKGTTLTFRAKEPISSLYIKWDSVPKAADLKDGGSFLTVGEKGFLHEFVPLSGTSKEVTLTIPSGGAVIADVYAFSEGKLPDFVQKWNEPWDRADLLFLSAHADDEVLFFGGMIPIYTNEDRARVQVAYFTDFFQTEPYRNHEILDGLWTMGVDHYPQLGRFFDHYSESLEETEGQYKNDKCLDYVVEVIRKFKPQVLVTHDENGEYGHGVHRYLSKLVRKAVEISGDAEKNSASAVEYGVWDVPKTYLHLYPKNRIEMDTRAPLSDFDGKNALEVAKEAYQMHESQLWTWFFVDDGYDENGEKNDYKYSCAKYGLFRTTVGKDTSKDDVLDNLVTYDQQEEEAAKALEEAATEPETRPVPAPGPETQKGVNNILLVILLVAIVLIIANLIFYLVSRRKARKKAEADRK